ncbi:MAG: hypothetical protein IJT98_10120 [Prevotella sp.]|nr:hypothetical protein [Prevotella sp.]
MKKLYSLTTLLLMGIAAASAQDSADKSFTLTRNRVIYLTCDTMTIDPAFPEDTLYWNASMLQNPFNDAGMALGGMDATDWNYQVAFRNNYTDPETGFTLNRGYYRGITLMETTLGLYGKYMNLEGEEFDYSAGYRNLKKVILYFVPLPNAKCASYGYNFNHDRLPSNGGRIEAQYMNPDGTAKSNNAYRDPSIGTTLISGGTPDPTAADGWSWDEYYYNLTDCPLNYAALDDDAFITGYNAALVTIDQPFKLSVDLTNPDRSTKYDDQTEEGKKTEFTKLPIDGLSELEMKYYFADVNDCWPFDREPTDEEVGTYTSATGYNLATQKWGKKVNWSADTPIRIGIKRRLYLVGIALVCGTDGAETEYLNAGDYNILPAFTTEHIAAFGNTVSGELPADPWADRRIGNAHSGEQGITSVLSGFAAEAPTYNLQGQRVSAQQRGIVVRQGRKIVNQ